MTDTAFYDRATALGTRMLGKYGALSVLRRETRTEDPANPGVPGPLTVQEAEVLAAVLPAGTGDVQGGTAGELDASRQLVYVNASEEADRFMQGRDVERFDTLFHGGLQGQAYKVSKFTALRPGAITVLWYGEVVA